MPFSKRASEENEACMIVERGACICFRVADAPHGKLLFSQEIEEVTGLGN